MRQPWVLAQGQHPGSRADFPLIVASPQARNSIERFNPAVLNAMLDELPTGHDAWTAAYADPELFTWLLEQRRKPATRQK